MRSSGSFSTLAPSPDAVRRPAFRTFPGGQTCVAPPQSAIDTCIGFLSIIIWPSIIIGGVSGIITLVAAVKAKQAHGSLGK